MVGMGGLGHMAVRVAHAMGAEVTVLSQTLSKKDDGLRLSADHYDATSDDATFTDLANSFDLIIDTVSAAIEFCAEHGIAPEIDLISAADINDAWERVIRSDVRYREQGTHPLFARHKVGVSRSETTLL